MTFVDQDDPAVLAALRSGSPEEGQDFLVLANFDTGSSHRLQPDLSPAALRIWDGAEDLLNPGRPAVSPASLSEIHIEPLGIRVFLLRRLS